MLTEINEMQRYNYFEYQTHKKIKKMKKTFNSLIISV